MDRTVGPYQLGETLGTLPFGELVAATHAARSEPLAVLLLDERLAADVRLRGLLRLEMARAAGLRHPALARTVETGESAGALYLVVERPIGGKTLASILSDGTTLPADRVISLVRQLAEGLDAAHARRLLHGAIDPSCILVGPDGIGEDGSARVVGLGILPAAEEAGLVDAILERQGPAFVAPEQTSGPRAVASADGYALGVIAATLVRQRAGVSGIDPAVAAVLERQAARTDTARFSSCVDFATALAEALAGAPAGASGPTGQASTAEAPPATTATPALTTPTVVEPPPAAPRPTASPPKSAPPSVQAGSTAASVVPTPTARIPAADSVASAPARPSQPADFGGWVRDVIDPPKAEPPAATAEPATLHPPRRNSLPGRSGVPLTSTQQPATSPPVAAPSKRAEVSITTTELTPAMLNFVQRQERQDPLGDVVRWVAGRAPSVEALLDTYCPTGKVGPFPLGIAAAGVLALLLLVAMQFVLATAVVMLVVVLYAVPRLITKLSGEQHVRQQAVRVRGPAMLRRSSHGVGWETYELELGNQIMLSVDRGEVDRLKAAGRPVTIARPSAISSGTEDVTLQHDLPDVAVTYLSMSKTLLDVRDDGTAVLVRHPRYAGEPGDVLATSVESGRAQPSTTRRQSGRGETVTFPIPADIRAALDRGYRVTLKRLALIALVPLGLLVVTFNTQAFGFALVVVFGAGIMLGAPILEQVLKLRAALRADTFTRVAGPLTLLRHAGRNSSQHRLLLEDGTALLIDADLHATLARAGQLRMGEDRESFWDTRNRTAHLVSMHEIPAMTVTYEPSGGLLLEIVNSFGQALYRDPALGTQEIAAPAPHA